MFIEAGEHAVGPPSGGFYHDPRYVESETPSAEDRWYLSGAGAVTSLARVFLRGCGLLLRRPGPPCETQ